MRWEWRDLSDRLVADDGSVIRNYRIPGRDTGSSMGGRSTIKDSLTVRLAAVPTVQARQERGQKGDKWDMANGDADP